MNDGLFHVSVLKPFKFYQVFGLVFKILRRKADTSKLIEAFACDELIIERKQKDVMHYDGEPSMTGETVVFKMKPLSLKAITGEKFTGV
jgi:diacylglycerol kinase (ATP)